MLVEEAHARLNGVVCRTPLELNRNLSDRFDAQIYLKREDLQVVRSYKLRGAYNRISLLSLAERGQGVVCASAGNHAQGFAFSCRRLGIRGSIYMPKNTPRQKVDRVKFLGGSWVSLILVGDVYDDAYKHARADATKGKKVFIHPFDDLHIIAGQGTVGLEILEQFPERQHLDYVIVPVGGAGLIAGLGGYVKSKSPSTKLVGVEPLGAPSMSASLQAGKVVTLEVIDKFVDGAAVKTVGVLNFAIAQKIIDRVVLVNEGHVCQEMISLYQNDGIVTEPAGALSVSALDEVREQIKGKTVVCVVSGGNNDISRYPEIIERSLVYRGLKHYFIVEFSQRPGALKMYLNDVLGELVDITLFEYMKKNNRESGPALVGVELSQKDDLKLLLRRMKKAGLSYEHLEKDSPIFRFLV